MSWMQSFFLGLMPKGFRKSAEDESRLWMVQCPHCGAEESIWDMGGLRWKATGNPRTLRKCRLKCGKTGWHKVYKREA